MSAFKPWASQLKASELIIQSLLPPQTEQVAQAVQEDPRALRVCLWHLGEGLLEVPQGLPSPALPASSASWERGEGQQP